MTMFSWFPESVAEMRNRENILWIYGWYKECMPIDIPLHAFLTHPMICYMVGATGFCSFWNAVTWGDDYLTTPFMNAGQNLFYPGGDLCPDHVLPSLRLKVLRNQMQLVDLMMTTDGLEREASYTVRKELEEMVNEAFGYENNNAWWSPKPDCINTPPRYWDYSTMPIKQHHQGHSPKMIDDLRRKVLRRLG